MTAQMQKDMMHQYKFAIQQHKIEIQKADGNFCGIRPSGSL
jgi:hypothetical protein